MQRRRISLPDWKWNWALIEKFKVLCQEFNGIPKEESGDIIACKLTEFDDFKAFTHWMHSQKKAHPTKTLTAKYVDDNDIESWFTAEFNLWTNMADQLSRDLHLKERYSLGFSQTINDFIDEGLDFRMEDSDWQADLTLTKDEQKELIKNLAKPYLADGVKVDTFFDNNDDHWYADAEVNFIFENHGVYSSVLKDAEETCDMLTKEAGAIFTKKLNDEIDRLRPLRGRRPAL
jgi:hypothetical protein